MIIDAQVHSYPPRTPERPWADAPGKSLMVAPSVTGDEMLAAMDAVGVDRAINVSPWTVFRGDTSYAESVYRQHPDRFRLVAPIDVTIADIEGRVEEWAATPGAVAARILFLPSSAGEDHPGVMTAAAAVAKAGLPINVFGYDVVPTLDRLPQRTFPDAQFVIDHVGVRQPWQPPVPADALDGLDAVLELAQYPNIAVKITGACTYSRRPFPYPDIWEPIGRVFDAFGINRCMWGTDWTRTLHLLSYDQGTSAFRDHWPLSESDGAALMGGTLLTIYDWDGAPTL